MIRALADPTRRSVFEKLRRGPQAVGRLAEQLDVTRPAVSQHLKVLEQAGLVRARREGTRRIYSVEIRGLAELRRYLNTFWDDATASFEAEAKRSPRGSKHGKR
jgi:DNA-binding transcriptional ArsR family regulator